MIDEMIWLLVWAGILLLVLIGIAVWRISRWNKCPKCGGKLEFDNYEHYECKCGYREKA